MAGTTEGGVLRALKPITAWRVSGAMFGSFQISRMQSHKTVPRDPPTESHAKKSQVSGAAMFGKMQLDIVSEGVPK